MIFLSVSSVILVHIPQAWSRRAAVAFRVLRKHLRAGGFYSLLEFAIAKSRFESPELNYTGSYRHYVRYSQTEAGETDTVLYGPSNEGGPHNIYAKNGFEGPRRKCNVT